MLNSLLTTLETMPDIYKVLWLAICLSGATAAELLIPLVKSEYKRLPQLRVNLFFLLTTFIVNAIFSLLLVRLLPVLASYNIGLFNLLSLPLWIELLAALLILDLLAQYTIHYLLHNVKFLWRFHQVHHSDLYVNATTGTRHHPIDYCAREMFSLLCIVALGAPLGVYMFYRLITVFCTYFTHSNISLPHSVDRALSFVIVTPNAHKFHHHSTMSWTNRNYGNIFSVWDRLFGTFVYESTDKIHYGVDTMDEKRADSVWYQLTKPFNRHSGSS